MKLIPLTRGKFAKVDDEDYDKLTAHKWHCTAWGYACRGIWVNKKVVKIWMHREIMDTPKGSDTDHINMDRLDNQKANLRILNRSQNMHNLKPQRNNTSGYVGVFFNKRSGKWLASTSIHKKSIWLGLHETKEIAAEAYSNYVRSILSD